MEEQEQDVWARQRRMCKCADMEIRNARCGKRCCTSTVQGAVRVCVHLFGLKGRGGTVLDLLDREAAIRVIEVNFDVCRHNMRARALKPRQKSVAASSIKDLRFWGPAHLMKQRLAIFRTQDAFTREHELNRCD